MLRHSQKSSDLRAGGSVGDGTPTAGSAVLRAGLPGRKSVPYQMIRKKIPNLLHPIPNYVDHAMVKRKILNAALCGI